MAIMSLCVQFFTTEPYACDPSELPKHPPSKEIDVKLREEEARRYDPQNILCVFPLKIDVT